MPALTHNRVKNGFNGGIRKNNATPGTKYSRTLGAAKADSTRSKALVGDIGSIPSHIRAAYKRRVRCECEVKRTPKTYNITVTVDGANKFVFNGDTTKKLIYYVGDTYVYDLSHNSNLGHPLIFVTDATGTKNYEKLVVNGTPGNAGATVTFTPKKKGNVFVFCQAHAIAMGDHYNNLPNGISVVKPKFRA